MLEPRIISLDEETHGICTHNHAGAELPLQNYFHPQRSLRQDNVPLADLIQTIAITIPKRDPRPTPSTPWSATLLGELEPGDTMVFKLYDPAHRLMLLQWLNHADTILGWNICFDLIMGRALPWMRPFLTGRHTLIDGQVVAFLENEQRYERSLKDIGPVLGTHRYDENFTAKTHRFTSPDDPKENDYNGQDTHNTLTDIARLANRILRAHANTDKLSPYCITFYSDLIWSVVQMLESGIPMSLSRLTALESSLSLRAAELHATLIAEGLTISGEGTELTRRAILTACTEAIDGGNPCPSVVVPPSSKPSRRKSPPPSSDQLTLFATSTPTPPPSSSTSAPTSSASTTDSPAPPSASSATPPLPRHESRLLNHPLLLLTEKKREVSFNNDNRRLIRALLPEKSTALRRILDLVSEHTSAQKLVSSYTFPLLRHKRNDDEDQTSRLLRTPGSDVGIAYPSCYIVPGKFRDNDDSEGGQVQVRLSVKNPSGQTFPPDIAACITSRYGDEGCIVNMDLSQIELRVAGVQSGDPFYINGYKQAKPDLHTDMTVKIMGPDIVKDPNFRSGDRRNDPRQWGKPVNFWHIYRGGPNQGQRTMLKLSGKLFPREFFTTLVNSRPLMTPMLWEWQERLLASAERNGIVYLPITGHSRYFTGYKRTEYGGGDEESGKSLMNEIVNFPVQAPAAITTHRIMSYITKRIPSQCHFFLHVHDALKFDCHISQVPRLLDLIDAAVSFVANHDYWAMLCNRTGHFIKLVAETSTKTTTDAAYSTLIAIDTPKRARVLTDTTEHWVEHKGPKKHPAREAQPTPLVAA